MVFYFNSRKYFYIFTEEIKLFCTNHAYEKPNIAICS